MDTAVEEVPVDGVSIRARVVRRAGGTDQRGDSPMRYMLLISAEEPDTEETVGHEGKAAFTAWLDGLIARGVLRAHEGLQPSRSATTVRVRGDQVLLTDGPYLEAKDQIGGFALIEVDDLDLAVEIAAAHPACGLGQIEIRPLRDDVRYPWKQ